MITGWQRSRKVGKQIFLDHMDGLQNVDALLDINITSTLENIRREKIKKKKKKELV